MFGHGGDDRDVGFGIGGIQKRVETSGPRRDVTSQGANQGGQEEDKTSEDDGNLEHQLEGLGAKEGPQPVDEAVDLQQTEDAEGGHVLSGLDGLEAYEGDLHGKKCAQGVHGAVGDVKAIGVAAGDEEHQDVQRDKIDNEDISSPCRHHVKVGQRG